MSQNDEPLKPLRDDAQTLESTLLRSAGEDQPAPGVQQSAILQVLAGRRREANRRRRLRVGLGAAVALAAGVALLVRTQTRAPALQPEPPASTASTRAVLPPPSASAAPVSPLAPCTPPGVGSGTDTLIDDFEDGDCRLRVSDKRAGYWIAFNDGTAKQEPRPGSLFTANRIPGGRGDSHFGLHSSGGKFSKWGAALSVELNPRRCYDASAYAGVSFWARGRAQLRVAVKMTQVIAEEFGGSCVDDCYDGHGVDRPLTADWQPYQVRWEELTQKGNGRALPFDPHSLFALEFGVRAGAPFDFWIDDVAFIAR